MEDTDGRHELITYTANKLIDKGYSNYKDILATWKQESNFNPEALNDKNSNGTFDSGACQLNSAYHSPFIASAEFKDPYKQIDYCISVLEDATRKKRPIGKVWYGYANKDKHIPNIKCT
jgi:hypothetical protein